MKYLKKSLGQNFLTDSNIITKIVNLTNISNKNVLEIGPGRGALTNEILKNKPKSLILIEKDYTFSNELKLKYSKNKKIKIFNQDILKFDLEKNLKKNSIIFGNLPYNISSQILVKVVKFKKWPPDYTSVIFMFQKEMADRITGKFKTSKYGRLSILTSFRLNILDKFNISPSCFFPKPKVDSTVIHFATKSERSHKIDNIDNLEKITNILFSQKRKMINKSIKKILTKDKLKHVDNLDLSLRPSDLKPSKFYEITELFEKL